ncbi:MAG: NAD(P)H-hydrate dehydratase [Candidatus Nanosalina sp.]
MENLLRKLDRDEDSHKGQNGQVGVIGGSRDYSGAPALSAEAALRTGTDLTKILTSSDVQDIIRSYSENLIVESYEADYFGKKAEKKAGNLLSWSDATVIGSGLSSPGKVTLREVAETETPLIVDAEAIDPISRAEPSNAVFTPHEKEADTLRQRHGSLEEFAEKTGATVLLKGKVDQIYTPNDFYRNETGNPAMTVGGTGDVLTGIIASLISQGLEPGEASRLGAWINGRAGELAAEELGNGATAKDVIDEIPEALIEKRSG